MPQFEPKEIQKELEAGKLRPVYWLHGPEQMTSRELLQRIRRAALGSVASSFAEDRLDGTEVSAAQVVDSVLSLSLGGGLRFVVVKEAHAIRDTELLNDLLGDAPSPPQSKDELSSVCVFLSKDLDQRRKFSKLLVKNAAVVGCESVSEDRRDAWIAYLAKQKGVTLTAGQSLQLRCLEPWTLDIVDQELEKYSISLDPEVLQGGGATQGSDRFVEAFLMRNQKAALAQLTEFVDAPESSIPLLGLLAWNARFLALSLGGSTARINPYLAEKLPRWSKRWTLKEALKLQAALADLDYCTKQTPLTSMGLWTVLVNQFCDHL